MAKIVNCGSDNLHSDEVIGLCHRPVWHVVTVANMRHAFVRIG